MQPELKLAAAQVNFWTCLVITVFLLIAVIRLEKTYRNHGCRFVFHSMLAWLLGWIVWVILWGIAGKYKIEEGDGLAILVLLLSDLNTVFYILTYIGLTRGREFPPTQYLLLGFLLVLSVGGVDFALLEFPGKEVGPTLQQRWSMALSMLSPVLLGWAFRLRYATPWVLIAGIIYAFLQPPAYEALFIKSLPSQVESFTDGERATILSILSMLKVVYAFSVLAFLAKTPSSSDSLVQSPMQPIEEKAQDSFWQLLPILLLIVGCTAVLAIVKSKLQIAWQVFVHIGVYVLTLAALLKALEAIGKSFRMNPPTDEKKTDEKRKATGTEDEDK